MIQKIDERNYVKYNLVEMKEFFKTFLSKRFLSELTDMRSKYYMEHIQDLQNFLFLFNQDIMEFIKSPSIEKLKNIQRQMIEKMNTDEFENIMINIFKEMEKLKCCGEMNFHSFSKNIVALYFFKNIGNFEDFDYKTSVFLDDPKFWEDLKMPYLQNHIESRIYSSLINKFNNIAISMKYNTVLLDHYLYSYVLYHIIENQKSNISKYFSLSSWIKFQQRLLKHIPKELYEYFKDTYNKLNDLKDQFFQCKSASEILDQYCALISIDEAIKMARKLSDITNIPEELIDEYYKGLYLIIEYGMIINKYDKLYSDNVYRCRDFPERYGDEYDDYDEIEYDSEIRDNELDYNPWEYHTEKEYGIDIEESEMTYINILDDKYIKRDIIEYIQKQAEVDSKLINLIPEKYRDRDLRKELLEEEERIQKLKEERAKDPRTPEQRFQDAIKDFLDKVKK